MPLFQLKELLLQFIINSFSVCLSGKLFLSPSILNVTLLGRLFLIGSIFLSALWIYYAAFFWPANFLLRNLIVLWGFPCTCHSTWCCPIGLLSYLDLLMFFFFFALLFGWVPLPCLLAHWFCLLLYLVCGWTPLVCFQFGYCVLQFYGLFSTCIFYLFVAFTYSFPEFCEHLYEHYSKLFIR